MDLDAAREAAVKSSDRYLVDGVMCVLNGKPMRVFNLSVGGLFAATKEPPMPGQFVSLELHLKDRTPFAVLGQVTWINNPEAPRSPDLPQGFGIKITKIEFPNKLAILDLLKRSKSAVRGRGAG
jgi:Tfp pilus assembly protein PilZ